MSDAEANLLAGFQALIEREVDRRVRPIEKSIQNLRLTGPQLDEATAALIREQMLLASKSYLTRKEAAMYLNVSERSISDWAARHANDNPFPMVYAGGEPRVKRKCIDEWAEHERTRQRLKLAG
jgi:excisionase family DNA binding protein